VSEQCFSLLRSVLLPDLKAGLLRQLLKEFAEVRHLVFQDVVPCIWLPDFHTDDCSNDDCFFTGINTKKWSEAFWYQKSRAIRKSCGLMAS
jgi:hypothetical protein